MSASEQRLFERLKQILAFDEGTPRTKEGYRESIITHRCGGAVCARVPEVGGRVRVFAEYFADVFGEDLNGKPVKQKPTKQVANTSKP